MNKTFAELGYNVGDTVRCVFTEYANFYEVGEVLKLQEREGSTCLLRDGVLVSFDGQFASWELVSRAGSANADDEYLTWGDMTPEAQGALLLAEHNGAVVQEWNDGWKLWQITDCSSRYNDIKYRVKPADPVVVTHEISGRHQLFWGYLTNEDDAYKFTYNTIDGVVDCASVQMVEVEK
jgi:hypothetical protein